jgi:hypothetical protein
MMFFLKVKQSDTFSGQIFFGLGVLLVLLAGFAFAFSYITKKTPRYQPRVFPIGAISIPENDDPDSEKTIFERLKFKEAQEMYQQSYLELIKRINETDTSSIDVKKQKSFFYEYNNTQRDYRKVLKKLEESNKDDRLKCFARMRSLILAVMFHDRREKKKMTKFLPEKLIKMGALKEMPICPKGGTYSIIYKDGRRFFHCSIHGVLRN